MKPRVIFIHGNDTPHWSTSWAKWLKTELEVAGYKTFFETMPDSILARAKYWLPFVKEHIKADENDVLVGWSSGAVAAMRYAEGNKILGSVLVSPCYTDLGDEMEKQSGYYDDQWAWEQIKLNQKNIALIYGDADPFIPQNEFAFIAQQLQPEEIKIAGGTHFIERTEFPELLAYLKSTYS